MEGQRQTGQTATQMQGAPIRAVYVWCNDDLYYPRRLAGFLRREDLVIVSPSWLDRWSGQPTSGLVVDHAACLSGYQKAIAGVIYRRNCNLSLIRGLTGGVE